MTATKYSGKHVVTILLQQSIPSENFGIALGRAFQHFFISLKAAQEGLGLALIPDFLARQSIDEGKLSNPLQLQIQSNYGYYLLTPNYNPGV